MGFFEEKKLKYFSQIKVFFFETNMPVELLSIILTKRKVPSEENYNKITAKTTVTLPTKATP